MNLGVPEVLFEAVGSHGDVLPLIAIASELIRRGHRCRLLANEHFRANAQSAGLEFFATTNERVRSEGPTAGSVETYLFPGFEGVRSHFRLAGSHDAETVVVNLDRWAASEPFAEARHLRTIRLHLSPFKIRSLVAPAWPLGARVHGPNGEHYRTRILPALYRAFDTHPKVLARINGVRSRTGLAEVNSALYRQPHVVEEAALFPEWFASRAADWPALEFLGFPLPDANEELPLRLLEFLELVPRPLIFTPGTSVGQPGPFFEAAAECCTDLRLPGIFLSPFLSAKPRGSGGLVEHFTHAELGRLLPRAALLVHHGGIGTTARALEAGIPQIISPTSFDQPDNGRRIECLGAGSVLVREELDGKSLAVAVRALLDDARAAKLRSLREAIAVDRAIERGADLVEEVLTRRFRSAR